MRLETAPRREKDFSRLILTLAAAFAALISIQLQGFSFAVRNNYYHVPIFERWASEPAFTGDLFFQTLQYYTSGVWGLFRFLPQLNHTESFFRVFHFLARWATLAIMGAIAFDWGIRRTAALVALVLWFAVTPIFWGFSPVGGHDLFINYFSQTECALPVVLMVFLLAARKQMLAAFALTGILFDLSAFVAVWAAFALFAILWRLCRTVEDRRLYLRQSAFGIALAVFLALPVLWWTLAALTRQPAYRPFDYVDFLRFYFPNHFLIEAADPVNLLALAATIVAADVLIGTSGQPDAPWRAAFRGLVLLFVIGMFLPLLTHKEVFLNLHLLRVDGVLLFLAIMLTGILAVRNLTGNAGQRWAGACALLMLTLPNLIGVVFAGILLITAARREWSRQTRLALALCCLAVLSLGLREYSRQAVAEALITVAFIMLQPFIDAMKPPKISWLATTVAGLIAAMTLLSAVRNPPRQSDAVTAIYQTAQWARVHTDPQSQFLEPLNLDPDFGLLAKRRVWTNWKAGAAVMWSPSYYWTWWPRYHEAIALHDVAAKLDYACAQHLDYVLTEKTDAPRNAPDPLFENSRFRIYRIPAECGLNKGTPEQPEITNRRNSESPGQQTGANRGRAL